MSAPQDTPELLDQLPETPLLPTHDEPILLDAPEEEKLLPSPEEEKLLPPGSVDTPDLAQEESISVASPSDETIPLSTEEQEVTPRESSDEEVVSPVPGEDVPEGSPLTEPTSPAPSAVIDNSEAPTKSHRYMIIGGVSIVLLCIFAVIGYVLLGGKDGKTLFLDFTLENTEKTPSYEEQLAEQKKKAEQDIQLANQARDTRDTSICDKISDTSSQLSCKENLIILDAIDKKQGDLCDTVSQTGSRIECHDTIHQRQAIESKNTTLCANLSTEGKKSYCQETIEKDLLKTILESGSATEEVCSTLVTEAKNPCMDAVVNRSNENLLQNALASDTQETCDALTEGELRDYCYDTIILKRALTIRDASLCSSIKNEAKQTQCKTELVIKNETEKFREYVNTMNLTGCASLTDETLKNRCHDTVTLSLVRENKDIALCDTLTTPTLTEACKSLAQ